MAGDFEPGGMKTFISGIESSARRLRTNIDAIIEKYNKPFVDDDVINLSTMTIHKDNGCIRKLRGCHKLGTASLKSTKRKDELLRSKIAGNTPVIDPNTSMAIQRQYNCYLRRPDNRDGEPSDAETLDSDSSDEDEDKDSDEEEDNADDSEDFESGNKKDLEETEVSEKLEDFTGGKISALSESERDLDNERAIEQVRKSGNVHRDEGKRVNKSRRGQHVNDNERAIEQVRKSGNVHRDEGKRVNKSRRGQQVNDNERAIEQVRKSGNVHRDEGKRVNKSRRGQQVNDNESRRENVNKTRRVLLKSVREQADENGRVAKKSRRIQFKSEGDLATVSGRDPATMSGKVQHQNRRDLATGSGKVQHHSGRELINKIGRVQPGTGGELAGESGSQQLNGRRELANKSGGVQLKNERYLTNESGKDHVAKGGKAQSSIKEQVKSRDEQVSESGTDLVSENRQASNCVRVTRSTSNSFNTSHLDNSTSSALRNLSFVSYQSPKPLTKETLVKKCASVPSDNKGSTISQNHALQETKSILGCENLQKNHSVNVNTTYVKSGCSSSLSSRCEDPISESQLGSDNRKPGNGWEKKLSTSIKWQTDSSVIVDVTRRRSGTHRFSSRRKDPVCESQALLSSDTDGYERSFSELHLFSTSGTGQLYPGTGQLYPGTGQFVNLPPRTTRNITASSNLRQERTSSNNKISTHGKSENNVNKLSALLFCNSPAVNMDVTHDKLEMFTVSSQREGPVSESQVSLTSDIERPFSELKLSSASAIGRCQEFPQRTTRSTSASHNMNTEHPSSNNKMTTNKTSENSVKQLSASHFCHLQTSSSVNVDVTYEQSEMFSASSRCECPVSESQVSFSSATERYERPLSEFSTTSGSQRCEDVSQRTPSAAASHSLQTDCPSSVNRMSANALQKSKFYNQSLTDQSTTINLTSEKVSCVHSPSKIKNSTTQRRLSNTKSRPSKVSPRKKSAIGCQNLPVDFSSETVSISETVNNSTHRYNLRSKISGNVQGESANQSVGDVSSLTLSLKNVNIYSSAALVLSPHSSLAPASSNLASPPSKLTFSLSDLASPSSNLTSSQSKLKSPHSKLTLPQSNLASSPSKLTLPKSNLASPPSNLTFSQSDLASPSSNLASPSSNLTSSQSKLKSPRSKLTLPQSDLAFPLSNLTSSQSKLKSRHSKLTLPQSNLAPPPCKSTPSDLTFSCSNFAPPHSIAESPNIISAPSRFSMASSPSSLEFPFFHPVPRYSNSLSPSSNLPPPQTHLTSLDCSVSTQHNKKRLIPNATPEPSSELDENLVKCGLYVGSPTRIQKGVHTEPQCQNNNNQCSCYHQFLLLHGFNQDKWTSPRCEIPPNQSTHNPACGRLKRKAPGSFTSGYFTDVSTSPKRLQTFSAASLDNGLVVNIPPTLKTKCLAEPTYHPQDYASQQTCLSELCCLHGNQHTATVCHPVHSIARHELLRTGESVNRRFAVAKKQGCSQTGCFANHSSYPNPVDDNWYCLSHRAFREDCCYLPPSRTDSRECDWGKASSCRNSHDVPTEVLPQVIDSRVCEWVQDAGRTTNPNALHYASCFPKIQQNQLAHCSSRQLAASCNANHVSSPRQGGSSASHVPYCFQSAQTENQNTGFEDRIRNLAECSNHNHLSSPRHISANKPCRTSCPGDRVLHSSVEKRVHAVWKEVQAERYSADRESARMGGIQLEDYVSGPSQSCWGESNEADGTLDQSVIGRLDHSIGLKAKNRSEQISKFPVPMSSTLNTTAVELPSFVENHSPSPKFKVPKSRPPRLHVDPQTSMFPESFLEQFSPLNPARRDSDKSMDADQQKNSPLSLKSSGNSKPDSRHIYKQRSCDVTSIRGSQKTPGNRASTPVRAVHRLPEFCLDDTVSTIISSVSVAADERLRDVEDRVSPELIHSDDSLLADSDSFEIELL